jgi:site-specific DNA recombinase
MTTPPTRAAVYARKSTRDARETDDPEKSVARQHALARGFAASQSWDVVQSYTDDGVSGMHRSRLVGRAEMFLAAEQGRFDVLIVRDTDRLSRDDMEPDPVVTLKSAGVSVYEYSTGRPVDVSDATDRLVRNVHRYRGASEAESGSKRTRESKFAKAKLATIADGRVLGYRNTGAAGSRTREIDPEQAKLVVRIFKMRAGGAGYLKIARTLNVSHVKNPNGQDRRNTRKKTDQWSSVGIRAILRRELYIGRVTYGARRNVLRDGERKKTAGDQPVTVERPDLRIIEPALWQAVQRVATTRATNTGATATGRPGNGRDSKQLFSGMLSCGVCGGNLFYSRKTGQRGRPQASYACATRRSRGAEACSHRHGVPADELIAAVLAEMRRKFLNPAFLATLIEDQQNAGKREPDVVVHERDGLLSDAARLDVELVKLAEAIATGGDMPAILAVMRSKQTAKTNAEQRVVELTAQIAARGEQFDRRQFLIENRATFNGLSAELAGSDVQAARRVFQCLLVGPIVVTPQTRDDGVVAWTFACTASFAGLPAETWNPGARGWDMPKGRPNPNGLYAAESDDDTPDDPADEYLGIEKKYLLTGTLSKPLPRRVQRKCPRGDSNTRHAV